MKSLLSGIIKLKDKPIPTGIKGSRLEVNFVEVEGCGPVIFLIFTESIMAVPYPSSKIILISHLLRRIRYGSI
jgi:hypothetical protein